MDTTNSVRILRNVITDVINDDEYYTKILDGIAEDLAKRGKRIGELEKRTVTDRKCIHFQDDECHYYKPAHVYQSIIQKQVIEIAELKKIMAGAIKEKRQCPEVQSCEEWKDSAKATITNVLQDCMNKEISITRTEMRLFGIIDSIPIKPAKE